ncbi:hypothetical protein [Cryptosporangium aurantiacum]|uniref:hypothetical protein n=1 Tax=Cryptosporangium aurantiacum TaxID=134849 RepID=UPI0011613869|nr:hypothetical protein [Cryptosporangium aurantiacum]
MLSADATVAAQANWKVIGPDRLISSLAHQPNAAGVRGVPRDGITQLEVAQQKLEMAVARSTVDVAVESRR